MATPSATKIHGTSRSAHNGSSSTVPKPHPKASWYQVIAILVPQALYALFCSDYVAEVPSPIMPGREVPASYLIGPVLALSRLSGKVCILVGTIGRR